MVIKCNDWTLRECRLYISWATRSFYAVGHNNIMNRGAYYHRKGNIDNNPKI